MASKFMVNSALGARLLLRPSHQRTISFGIIYKLGCPITGRPMWPLVLGSKAYSGSSPTPHPKDESSQASPTPHPKDESSQASPTSHPKDESSQSSGRQGRGRFSKKWKKFVPWLGGFATSSIVFVTREFWFPDRFREYQRAQHESARESAILEKLKKGPEFPNDIEAVVLRENLIKKVMMHIRATERSRLYPLIIGEHGTGKTSLIQLAINSMDKDKPMGIAYVDIPVQCHSESDIAVAIQEGLGWNPDPIIDSDKSTSVRETLKFFSRVALKYRTEHKQAPVLIIDNVNRLAENKQEFLDLLQDYAKLVADQRIATVVFVSSEGCVPRRMTERSSWSRKGRIIEVDDMSKEEAFQFLKLRGLNEEQATQSYGLAGGRIIHLRDIADAFVDAKGDDVFQAIRQEMLATAQIQLRNANVLADCPYYKEGGKIIRELLNNDSIPENTYYSLVGLHLGEKLLETNAFALHLSSRKVTFQSTIVKRYCEENSDIWKEK